MINPTDFLETLRQCTHSLLLSLSRWAAKSTQTDEAGNAPVVLVPHERFPLPELRRVTPASGEVVTWLCPTHDLRNGIHTDGEERRIREGNIG